MFKDIKKYDEKVERVKLLYKYGSSRNIYNLCNLTKFKIMKNIFR